jgi:hypothetical protein
MAANSANRPFGRKSVAAAVKPAKFKAVKPQCQSKSRLLQKETWSGRFLSACFSFEAAAPAISMHFLRGNSIPIGSCQCRVRWQSNTPVIDPGAFSGAARKLATAAAPPYDSNQRFST